MSDIARPHLDTATPAGPLDGLLVADFSRVLAGPYATMLLADMGATVVKVESPSGDDTRTWVPPVYQGVSTYYLSVNRNKRAIALDFADSEDLALAQELARRADMVIENFKPGGLRRFQLDYDNVSERNPGILYASISGFGTTEEAARLPGYDLIVQAVSGLMSLTGEPEGPAFRAGISVFDVMAGLHATIGLLAALQHRNNTGVGQHLEINLMASALSGLVNQSGAHAMGGHLPYRMGNAHPSLFPYEPMHTKDGQLIIAAGNDRQFQLLCTALQIPEVADDARFATVGDRTERREELRPLLERALATRTSHEWFEALTEAGVPCGPINTIQDGVELANRLGIQPVVNAGAGERATPVVRHPIGFSRTPASYPLPPPELDEHGAELRRWLAEGAT